MLPVKDVAAALCSRAAASTPVRVSLSALLVLSTTVAPSALPLLFTPPLPLSFPLPPGRCPTQARPPGAMPPPNGGAPSLDGATFDALLVGTDLPQALLAAALSLAGLSVLHVDAGGGYGGAWGTRPLHEWQAAVDAAAAAAAAPPPPLPPPRSPPAPPPPAPPRSRHALARAPPSSPPPPCASRRFHPRA